MPNLADAKSVSDIAYLEIHVSHVLSEELRKEIELVAGEKATPVGKVDCVGKESVYSILREVSAQERCQVHASRSVDLKHY